jgi:hypothetical protein
MRVDAGDAIMVYNIREDGHIDPLAAHSGQSKTPRPQTQNLKPQIRNTNAYGC